ncbi:MAG TPA: FtsW/RodA/SpoVE family cell cycle protein, partial [Gammaproteobacteria bacterium]|nr:FtsW/RodA/SpoVE family cell cycle protein [Gammaproteobacteria bacterium]
MSTATGESNEAFDRLFLIACAFLIIGGIVMLASASMPISMKHFGSPFGYVNKQLFSIGLGLIGGLFIFVIPTQFWEKLGIFLPLISLILLA